MLVLPDRHGFRGIRTEASLLSFAGRTSFRGVVAVGSWPRAQVATWLPAGFEPAPPVAPRDDHPVLLLFGEQTRPELLRAGLGLPVGPSYGELGVFVPYASTGCGRLCTFVRCMWSTYFPAVWEGNHRYFAKDLATMRASDDHFVVADGSARPLVHAVFAADGGWNRVEAGVPHGLDAMRDAFALPVVGRPASGRLAGCYFDWDFGVATARPVRASIWIAGALVGDPQPHDLHVAPGDAIAVRDMTWRLSWPGSWTP